MATLIIDGERQAGTKPAKTLGELLADADERFTRDGRIVSALRLDGVDEPAFREPQVTGMAADGFEEIELESATPGELAGRCLLEAGMALDTLADAAGGAGMLYRAGRHAEASRQLSAITEGIGTVVAITGAASLGLGIDLASRPTGEGSLADLTATASRHLEALIAAQSAADWEGTADVLDAGLDPVLRAWSAACRALAESAGSASCH